MKNSNHNKWTDEMELHMIQLVDSLGVEKTTNKYDESTLSLKNKDKEKLDTISGVMNMRFGTTLTLSSISNRWHWTQASEDQKENIRTRRRNGRKPRKQTKQEATPSLMHVEELAPKTSNLRIADVIMRCSRLLKQNKMTSEELCSIIDELTQ